MSDLQWIGLWAKIEVIGTVIGCGILGGALFYYMLKIVQLGRRHDD